MISTMREASLPRVKDLGARIAIDDFGAGYTSFRNLRKLGVDMIKIDGAFVENLVRSDDDRTFVRTMIDLGRGLNTEDRRRMGAGRGDLQPFSLRGAATICRACTLAARRPTVRTGCVLVAAAPNLAVAHKLESNPDLGNQLDCNRRLLLLRGNRGAMPLAVNPCR